MDDKPIMEEWKEVANLIVGLWYNENEDFRFIFSLSENLLGRAKLIIIRKGKRPEETFYTLAVHPNLEIVGKTFFYFDIGFMGRPKYAIKSISPDKMTLKLMDYITYKEIMDNVDFNRTNDLGFADEILEGLD